MSRFDDNDMPLLEEHGPDPGDEHSESLSPRVFYTIFQMDQDGVYSRVYYARHYEISRSGHSVPWKELPVGQFPYLHFTVKSPTNVKMIRPDNKLDAYWAGTNKMIHESVGASIPTLER